MEIGRTCTATTSPGSDAVVPIACYLLREDGEWYVLGSVPRWFAAFATFMGPVDGSVVLNAPDDLRVLALRLDDYGHDLATRERFALDIIRWSAGRSIKFVTELDPEVLDPDVLPSPITGRLPI